MSRLPRTLARRARRLRDDSGAVLVEFALVIPILLVVLFGAIDFGKAFTYWIDETHLANEGARWAVVNHNPGSGTLQAWIKSQAESSELRNGGSSTLPAAAQVCVDFPSDPVDGTTGQVGDPVVVTVTATYHWLPFLVSKVGVNPTVSVQGKSVMRLEALPTVYGAGCA
jgi:Flp pilus assembly protein TadG